MADYDLKALDIQVFGHVQAMYIVWDGTARVSTASRARMNTEYIQTYYLCDDETGVLLEETQHHDRDKTESFGEYQGTEARRKDSYCWATSSRLKLTNGPIIESVSGYFA